MMASVSTSYGDFKLTRSDAVAITVVRVKRRVRHNRITWEVGDLTHIEHRRKPGSIEKIKLNHGSWATYMATFDLNGRHLILSPHCAAYKKPKEAKKISKRSADLIADIEKCVSEVEYQGEYGFSDVDKANADKALADARAALEKRILFLENRQMVRIYQR